MRNSEKPDSAIGDRFAGDGGARGQFDEVVDLSDELLCGLVGGELVSPGLLAKEGEEASQARIVPQTLSAQRQDIVVITGGICSSGEHGQERLCWTFLVSEKIQNRS